MWFYQTCKLINSHSKWGVAIKNNQFFLEENLSILSDSNGNYNIALEVRIILTINIICIKIKYY